MSLSVTDITVGSSPVPMSDIYFISAGQIRDVTIQVNDNPGLLGNDKEVVGGLADGSNLTLTGIGSSPDAISGNLTLTSAYGEWTVQPDGSFAYTANGLASKQLSEGELASDLLYYQEVNQGGKTAIGQAAMNIIFS